MARGPAYPYINLASAVDYVRKLYDYAKRSPANLPALIRDKWEMSPTSSSSVKIVAALRYFGLADIGTSGETETLKISDRAFRILIDSPESDERKKALRAACLAPKAYKLCWDVWGVDMPPSMRSTLIFEHGFIENTVDGFLANYKKSVQFAGLLDQTSGEKRVADAPDEDGSVELDGDPLESTDATATPQHAHTSAMQHIITAPSLPAVQRTGQTGMPAKGEGMRQEVFALAEGDVVIQWPARLSAESLEDFNDWLVILKRKVARAVQQHSSVTLPADQDRQ